MKIEIDESKLKGLVSEAVMKFLDEETRNTLIMGAIQYLLTPENKSGYGRDPTSPLEDAYRGAVGRCATIVAREIVDGEYKEKVEGVVRDALKKVFEPGARDKLVERLVEAMGEHLWKMEKERY